MCHARSDLGALSKIVGEKEKKATKIIKLLSYVKSKFRKNRALYTLQYLLQILSVKELLQEPKTERSFSIYARQLLSSPRSPVGFLA